MLIRLNKAGKLASIPLYAQERQPPPCLIINRPDGYRIWLWGKAYKLPGENSRPEDEKISRKKFAERLLDAIKSKEAASFLRALDAYFAAVIRDSKQQRLHFITDHLGAYPLYLWRKGWEEWAWSNDLRDFLSLKPRPALNRQALACFSDLGHLLGPLTWFEGVERLPAATHLVYDLKRQHRESRRYWQWPKPMPGRDAPPFEEAVDATERLFRAAVRKRMASDGNTGLLLSGGLDSRLVLAAAVKENLKPHLLTMGMAESEDLKIARRLSKICKLPFHPMVLSPENFLQGRREATLITNGLISAEHLHEAPFIEQWVSNYKQILGGITLEVTLGGEWRGSIQNHFTFSIQKFTKLSKWIKQIYFIEDDFYNGRLIALLMDSWEINITLIDNILFHAYTDRAMPFADKDLLEYVLRLPDAYRKNHRLYFRLALKHYPDFFAGIPWAKTGLSIAHPLSRWMLRLHWPGIRTRIFGPRDLLADYKQWMRREPARTIIQQQLNPGQSEITALTGRNLLQEQLSEEEMFRMLTLEWWLKYVQNPTNQTEHNQKQAL